MADPLAIRFGKGEKPDGVDDTLTEAVEKLHADGDAMRDLALAHALTGEPAFAAQAVRLMADWARRSTVVDFHDFAPDYAAATHLGATKGFFSDRPWNFGLDAMWQAYGLVNAADALLLLRAAGWAIPPAEAAAIEDWLARLTRAVNASLHAWTRWADANEGALADFHATSSPSAPTGRHAGVERHRADNHLSWALVGLLAGAAALDDRALAAHALEGGVWDDGRSGPYANPSSIRAVIDRAIEAGDAAGRLFEERIGRRPTIGYALFHLQAMALAARIAALRFDDPSVWTHRGADGAGMLDAFRRYAPYVTGALTSPDPREAERGVRATWLFALSPEGYGGAERAALMAAAAPPDRMTHALGPARLLTGEGAR